MTATTDSLCHDASHRREAGSIGRGRVRVGFVAQEPLDVHGAVSGMPAAAARALGGAGVDVVELRLSPSRWPPTPWWRGGGTASFAARAVRSAVRHVVEPRALRRTARALSARLDELVATAEVDVLIGVCISYSLSAHSPSVPIVYCSDGTARLASRTYPSIVAAPRVVRDLHEAMEQRAMSVSSAILMPFEAARRSAIDDYGCRPERVHVVPLGANVTPRVPLGEIDAPSRDRLELLLVASDPERKRLGFCIDVATQLRARGVDATLRYVGPPRAIARRSRCVASLGQLRLGDPAHLARHEEALARSHLMLLPSLGEMVGIATVEAAHFGRPSVVRDVGGLAASVLDGETGIVMPPDASPADYAHRIEALVDDPVTYHRLSRDALERARRELNWDAWARSSAAILRAVARVP